ncbi:hypothetical protein DENIS_2126 [Desulfonema ishimotonii]|uniref:Oxygen sensor histidine kinase NreB n=1 Tax=Desulfonema ishimotonii TaxID=45657 RepID=A0A401FW22_9BACT|nr:CHASE4 domain-containing protein [Desulfonema ishimotonii]GBC61166.1 hypothetical protein DENIS_2126 [Desulfonema ishimotonii]
MSLRSKISGILLAVTILYGGGVYGIQRLIIFPSYVDLERNEARKDMIRCMEALRREIRHLDMFVHDWAAWDDTYRFVRDRNADYIRSNLISHTFSDNRLNLIHICNEKGETLWGEIHDPASGRTSAPGLSENRILFRHETPESSVAGILVTQHAPMLIVSRPIITSDHEGPVRGCLIMGRFLNTGYVRMLTEQTRVSHRIWPVTPGNRLPEPARSVLSRITPEHPIRFTASGSETLHVYTTFPDIYGHPGLLVRADIPRGIYARGLATMRFALFSTCAASLLILLILTFLLRTIITSPLSKLTKRVITTGSAGEMLLPLFPERTDEIGILCREFSRMVWQLNRVYDSLKETNSQLIHEAEERERSEKKLLVHQARLQELSAELVLAEERERRRIATELHDRIGQTLALSKIKLFMLMESQPECCLREKLEEIRRMIEQIMQDSRSLTFELSPPVLYDLGLEAAIEWLAEQIESRHGLCISICNDSHQRLPEESLRVITFRAVRELLINVVKHAHARHAEIYFGNQNGYMRIEIRDDGIGFNLPDAGFNGGSDTGFGLFSIRERLKSLGGHFEIRSDPGTGTCVTLLTPLRPDSASGERK